MLLLKLLGFSLVLGSIAGAMMAYLVHGPLPFIITILILTGMFLYLIPTNKGLAQSTAIKIKETFMSVGYTFCLFGTFSLAVGLTNSCIMWVFYGALCIGLSSAMIVGDKPKKDTDPYE